MDPLRRTGVRQSSIARWIFCLGLIAVGPAAGEQLNQAQLTRAAELREAALESELAWQLVESLTTEVGARMGGTEADARAVAWAQDKLEQLGFDRVWTEPVRFPLWVRGEESAEVLSPYAQTLHITALGGSPATPGDGITAPVREFASLKALEAQADGSLDGAIAFINKRMERHRDGSGYGPAVAGRSTGPLVAAAKGASALLIRSVGTDSHRFPHTGNISNDFERQRVPAAALSNPDADQLERLLGLDGKLRLRLAIDAGYRDEVESYNVIGEVTGRSQPNEWLVLGAHLDSWDLGTGAIDDGAGVGLVMAAAHLVGSMAPPARSLRVVLYANEEQGLWGAKAYAERHREDISQHVLGGESDFGAGRIYALRARVGETGMGVIRQIAGVLEPLGIALDESAPAGGGPDVGRLRELGMPVVDLRQDGSDYFDYHHTPDDTLDKIDPAALRQNLAAWAVLSYLAADSGVDFRPSAAPE